MAYAARLPRSKRAALLSSVAAVHVAVLLLVMMTNGSHVTAKAAARGPSLISLPREPPPPTPAPLRVFVKPLAKLAAAPQLPPPLASPALPFSDFNDCSVEDVVAKAIIANPASLEAVDQAPIETLSLSDAAVIWNTGWTDATQTSTSPLVAVRRVVLDTLASIDGPCLDVPVVGPRLIAVPFGDKTRLLVFGSGTWTWRQLIADDEAQPLPHDENSAATGHAQPALPPETRNELLGNALK